jgi:hypothetical protein
MFYITKDNIHEKPTKNLLLNFVLTAVNNQELDIYVLSFKQGQ